MVAVTAPVGIAVAVAGGVTVVAFAVGDGLLTILGSYSGVFLCSAWAVIVLDLHRPLSIRCYLDFGVAMSGLIFIFLF